MYLYPPDPGTALIILRIKVEQQDTVTQITLRQYKEGLL